MLNKILIAEIFDTDFDPRHKMGDPESYSVRRASRGVLVNGNKVAILDVTKHRYHKLPGGGIKHGESIEAGFRREVAEEVGCDCQILDQGGIVIEWRDKFKVLQISYVFLAKVVGEVGQNKFEQDEVDDGFKLEWVELKKADEVLKEDSPTDYQGTFVIRRDKSIIEFYRKKLPGT